jgi:adenylosuccinate lyase
MKKIWSQENKYRKWLDVEIFACEAMAGLGLVPPEALQNIKNKAHFTVARVDEIEAVTNHDVIAFLTCVAEYVGDDSKYIHMGLTSSDVLDTSLAAQMKEAGELILSKLKELRPVLLERAAQHRNTIMMGRTHGVHAEPITFGLKMLLWVAETDRNIERMERALEAVSVGKISGVVGTYANINPAVEAHVCQRMGLTPAAISTQVIQRDRHAEFLTAMAIIGSSLEKFTTEIRSLQRTEILEVEEYFAKGQKGSSAMPHKRNPITAERITGMARLLRGNALVAMENVALWNERDISHSSVERVIIPDSTTALDYMLYKFIAMIKNLLVYPENMRKNVELTGGLLFSQRVLLALINKGITRERAYELTQRNAMESWKSRRSFKELLKEDADVMALIPGEELDGLFDYSHHLGRVDDIYSRFGL